MKEVPDLITIKKINSHLDKVFQNLQQSYEKFSSITGYKTNEQGLFDQDFLISTWSEHGYDIYLFEVNSLTAGFAVINLSSMINHDKDTRDIAEFFIIPELRNQDFGTKFAQEIFIKYPGKWEVRQLAVLHKARKFWLKAIKATNPEDFQEEINNPNWEGYLQSFKI